MSKNGDRRDLIPLPPFPAREGGSNSQFPTHYSLLPIPHSPLPKIMVQAVSKQETKTQWITVCSLEQIQANTGVCALVKGEQVAVFRIGNTAEVYAISNYDPFSKTHVLSRGIVGDRNSILKVASPIYKQNFNLVTGQCLDNEAVCVPTFPARVVDGKVQIGIG